MFKIRNKSAKNLLGFRKICFFLLIFLLLIPTVGYFTKESKALGAVYATVETTPVLHSGDSADDMAIWIHPTNPSLSTIIGTDKNGNLEVYDLSGAVLQRIPFLTNNVDLRYNFPLGGQRVALVTGVDRSANKLFVYKVNPTTRHLEDVSTPSTFPGLLGSSMYVSPITGKYYAFTNQDSILKQYELVDNGSGRVAVNLVRTVTFGSFVNLTEGVTADDIHAKVYVSEEAVAIWKLGAEPTDGNTKVMVDKAIDQGGHFQPDIEGLAIYYKTNGTGYLIGSSQGNSTFTVYTREGNNNYLGTFNIADGGIDGVNGTDGIDVTNFPLGPNFPSGVFIAQDGGNTDENAAKNHNFKLVPFEKIAGALNLTMDTSWDPRLVGAGAPSNLTPVKVYIGNINVGNYTITPKSSLRQSYPGVDGGPVRVTSTLPMVASERVAYSPNGGNTWTSHSELMGLPVSQVATSYTFPWYNNLDLNSQLRFGNVGTATTTVTVTIGGVFKGNYTLAPNASTRISYPALDKGPVKITSSGNVPIIASMRVAHFDGSDWTSFSEMMGLPSPKLTNSYVFPWYNNLDLNSQLRFGNVGTATTTVTVTIGGVFKGNYTLNPNTSQRISYPGLDKGPVRVTSSGGVPIIASLRVAYFNGSAWSDFSEMMGMPASSLSTHYSFPIYDNVRHNSQLRFGNVGSVSTNVTVTINGVVKGIYNLAPNASQRISYLGLDAGPVVIQSSGNVPIIASERVAYFNGTAWTSFAEMMGLPQSQLATTFLFPWYNNVDLDTQLRFGVP
ncbi:MAG: phytase [Anaerolineales bacterium]